MKTSLFRSLLAATALISCLASAPAKAANVTVDGDLKMLCGTATGTSNASTLANKCGVITTESATTAAAATFLETITATGKIAAGDICLANVTTAGTGSPAVTKVAPSADTLAITIQNVHASAAFNAVLTIGYVCFRP